MQGKWIRGRLVLTTVGALALLGVGVGPALASGTPVNQPCTDATHCGGNFSATVTVNSEMTLTLNATSITLGPAVIAGTAASPTSGPTAITAGVQSYDNNGYSLELNGPGAPSTGGAFVGSNNPSDTIPIYPNLNILQGPGPGSAIGPDLVYQLGSVGSGKTAGTGCGATPGCTESGTFDDYAFGMTLQVAGTVPADSYSAPFMVDVIGL